MMLSLLYNSGRSWFKDVISSPSPKPPRFHGDRSRKWSFYSIRSLNFLLCGKKTGIDPRMRGPIHAGASVKFPIPSSSTRPSDICPKKLSRRVADRAASSM